MTAFRPTLAQDAAIRHAFADACVIAGAGSGKTAVLTRRYLEIVLEYQRPARHVAALTFTDKAASEMRDRIQTLLAESGRHALAAEVDLAPISTIHAFCARTLRLHAIEAGVDPAFQVLEGTEASLLLEDVWDRVLEGLHADDLPDLYVLASIAPSGSDLRGFLQRVRGAGIEVRDLTWQESGIDPAACEVRARQLVEELRREAAGGDAVLAERVRVATAEVETALAASGDRALRLAAARATVARLTNVPRPVVALRRDLVDELDALSGAALDDHARETVEAPLVRVLTRVAEAYEERKRDLGVLDFTDLELRTSRLLDALAAQGRRLARAPMALLVDEYQDTNPLQARILDRLRGPHCPLFSVGDPKQSIYRFRRADVGVITEEFERVGESGQHDLDATFRARPELVACCNHLHAILFAGGAAGVEHRPLVAEGAFREVSAGADVELAIVDAGPGTSSTERRVAEARYVAAWIRDLVAREVPRAKVEKDADGADRAPRPLGYGDVAVLFRARSDLSIYEDALREADVPFHTHKGRGYFQADEVVDLVHALRVVHDPADDHAFACLVTGPALAATDADLLRWFGDRSFGDPAKARRRAGEAWGRFWAEVEQGSASERARHVATTIAALRQEALGGNLARVVEGVLSDLGLLEVALLQPDGRRRAANLRKAVGVARDVERSGRQSLGDLLRHLALMRDREVAEAEAGVTGEDEDVVVLSTVHGAKGLEYPVVVLADTGRRPPQTGDPVVFAPEGGADGRGGFALRLRHPLEGSPLKPAAYEILRLEEAVRQEEESLRLLYVATTRAEERLLISGACSGFTKGKAPKPKEYKGWGPKLLDAFGGTPPRGGEERALGEGTAYVVLADAPQLPPRPVRARRSHSPSTAALREADRVLAAAAAPVAPLAGTPYVVTVSELLEFAASPAGRYARRLEPGRAPSAAPLQIPEPDDPASGAETSGAGDADLRAAERRRLWDEAPTVVGGVDRAALGRALHALLERWVPGVETPAPEDVARVVEQEDLPLGDPAVAGLLAEQARRFVRSRTGRRVAQAVGAGEDVRREMAFHARIRFPAGVEVGPFDALLVRGSIDLWLPEDDGIWIVDHKTNPRTARLDEPEAVARHYDWQLRLYALAAERVLGEDVAGARLLLVDPTWGEEAVEVAVDVSGPKLEDARRLCQAYATAELEGRWPENWRDLLDGA